MQRWIIGIVVLFLAGAAQAGDFEPTSRGCGVWPSKAKTQPYNKWKVEVAKYEECERRGACGKFIKSQYERSCIEVAKPLCSLSDTITTQRASDLCHDHTMLDCFEALRVWHRCDEPLNAK